MLYAFLLYWSRQLLASLFCLSTMMLIQNNKMPADRFEMPILASNLVCCSLVFPSPRLKCRTPDSAVAWQAGRHHAEPNKEVRAGAYENA